ncbi:MAG: DNA (cytosine-5-)-methyltransferase [Bacteroidales bacterium]|uniref:DNA (cytosine-5-)-methyltransferase n=1 Tax=Porphyromonas sp. TaxID=1924944 RepID=UPI002976E228|nr:DNA (cytosine-5-)-methyltransferase [Porphyromonas sp.]MDD7438198.1 DNA (cytosine-5-)-methyltransferase [Bacteroidales bacterium]MDY3066845.1 DNA (cytosine-5-)-methyltransferase [Porphyromonas sp.]
MNSSKGKGFKFIDLFAGLGGFHLALGNIGGECVFASEIQEELRELYSKNYNMKCHGDITQINPYDIPDHDVLCAGFPCQPFSKAGKQEGFEDSKDRGNLFYDILGILKAKTPKYVFLENVANLRAHDGGNTYKIIKKELEDNHYVVDDEIMSPHQFGIPQHRNRIYIVGVHEDEGGLGDFKFPAPNDIFEDEININSIIDFNAKEYRELKPETRRQIEAWDEFIKKTYQNGGVLPSFPIWSMEFGATYDYNENAPYNQSSKALEKKKGRYGEPIKGNSLQELLACLPKYAQTHDDFPNWKCRFIEQNRTFYDKHKNWIVPWLEKYGIKEMAASHQKFEWNCGQVNSEPTIKDKIIQFRPSGIRVKKIDYSPSLVLASTQTPIFPWIKVEEGEYGRYMTAREGAKLQGMQALDKLPKSDAATFRALGNAVNVEVVQRIAQKLIKEADV